MISLLDRLNQKSSSPLAWGSVWSRVPSSPGVYWFVGDADTRRGGHGDKQDSVLYVGKAKNLKNRIANYYHWQLTQGKTRKLVLEAKQLKFEVLESELEALLIEAELIRLHQPPYNVLLKDDKTPLYVAITAEPFPRVLTVRKKELVRFGEKLNRELMRSGKESSKSRKNFEAFSQSKEYRQTKNSIFGPFPSSFQLREVLKIARHIFPWCNQRDVLGKPCFYYHLDLCPGVCTGKISQEEYTKTIEQLKLFLRGKKKSVLQNLKKELKMAIKNEVYERAAAIQQRIELIETVTQRTHALRPDIALPQLKESWREEGLVRLRRLLSTHFSLPKTYPIERIEAYDVSNIQGTNPAVAMVVAMNGIADHDEYRLFNIRTLQTPNDYHMLQEALQRRQNHPEWGMPDVIMIDGGKGQLRAAVSVLQWDIPVIALAKDPDRVIVPKFVGKSAHTTRNLNKVTGKSVGSISHLPSELVQHTTEPVQRRIESFEVLTLNQDDPALHILQQLRDEAHRFAKKQHARLRQKNLLKS